MLFLSTTSMSFHHEHDDVVRLPCNIQFYESGWTVHRVHRLPEEVSAIVEVPDGSPTDRVYVGTSGVGSVYRLSSSALPGVVTTLASGLGDRYQHGTCAVNCLAVRDIDCDGTPELLAGTCQIQPTGRPRLYVWSLGESMIPRGAVRPDIASSWSHGLGFVPSGNPASDAIFSTYCGYGEIVEYRLAQAPSESGYRFESLGWRQVGQLPASGEATQTADIDNDGDVDVCVATGFSVGKAAIHVYSPSSTGIESRPKHIVDEGGRFGNVRFLVTDMAGDGTQELLAWWCTELAGGDCEIVRYRLGPLGLIHREVLGRGLAELLWPADGQMSAADTDRDGSAEVWFATGTGNLWRYDPRRYPALSQVCQVENGIGPICASDARSEHSASAIYVACREFVLLLRREE